MPSTFRGMVSLLMPGPSKMFLMTNWTHSVSTLLTLRTFSPTLFETFTHLGSWKSGSLKSSGLGMGIGTPVDSIKAMLSSLSICWKRRCLCAQVVFRSECVGRGGNYHSFENLFCVRPASRNNH